MNTYSREEVEQAYLNFVAVGDSGDWDAWADLHTQDCTWVEHNFGTVQGREDILKTIHRAMKPFPMMVFPVEWFMVEGSRVVYYPWQQLPDPSGGDEIYRFACVTILEYAGNNQWSYQEDIYNPEEGKQMIQAWLAAGGEMSR
jgi:hypothetical protein